MAEILPGVYIEVRPEALMVPGPVTVGNIGIVGTAQNGDVNKVEVLDSYMTAKAKFGPYDAWDNPTTAGHPLTLVRALELAYNHGASTVFAVRVANDQPNDYVAGLERLLNENVHIVVAAGLHNEQVGAELAAHCTIASSDQMKRDRIAVVGSKPDAALADITSHTLNSERVVFVAPGIVTTDAASGNKVTLPGAYAAAAIAGMLSARDPHVSLTNKTLAISGVVPKLSPAELEQVVQARVLGLEERRGFRVVKAITTSDNTAWHQITTVRIVDYAKAGVRAAAEPFIGMLNNDRVRKTLKGSINGFLAEMVNDEMLISYELDVTATREEEIRGICRVIMTLRPTFSIDFIKVVMFLG